MEAEHVYKIAPTLDISNFNIVLSVFGAFILLFGLCSYFAKEHLYVSEPLVAFCVGIAFGPRGAKFLLPEEWGPVEEITHNFARLVLGIQLLLIGVDLPGRYLRHEWKSLAMLLLPIMTTTWIIASLVIYLCFERITFLQAMIIGSCATPTDPVLSNSIVNGKFAEKHVAKNLRNIIIAEAGANDGFGYPFLFLALYLDRFRDGHGTALWIVVTVMYEIIMSVVYGTVIGFLFKKALSFCNRHDLVDRESFVIFAIAAALFIVGTAGLIGTDDLLACFVAGNVFTWDDFYRTHVEEESVNSTVDMGLNLAIFGYFGLIVPWDQFNDTAIGLNFWRYIITGIAVLLFKRLPVVLALWKFVPAVENIREAFFLGYFGPIGIGALFYVGISYEYLNSEAEAHGQARVAEILRPIVYFLIMSSIIVHGITLPTIRFGKGVLQSSRSLSVFKSKSVDREASEKVENDPDASA